MGKPTRENVPIYCHIIKRTIEDRVRHNEGWNERACLKCPQAKTYRRASRGKKVLVRVEGEKMHVRE